MGSLQKWKLRLVHLFPISRVEFFYLSENPGLKLIAFRGAFWILPNIYDGAFFENS